MNKLVNKIKGKLLEYNFEIYNEYPVENGEYLLLVNDMLIFVNMKQKYINISFQAVTKPDIVANNILILKEIVDTCDINIMDSFIFTKKNKVIMGDEAFDLIKKSIENNAIKDYDKQMSYVSILTDTKGFEC